MVIYNPPPSSSRPDRLTCTAGAPEAAFTAAASRGSSRRKFAAVAGSRSQRSTEAALGSSRQWKRAAGKASRSAYADSVSKT